MKPDPIKKVRILIADDHDIVRHGLRSLLESHKAWRVCGEASTGAETIEKSKRLKPDIVILDVNMPNANGVEVASEIRQTLPDTEVLVLTMDESPKVMHDILRAGVSGYIFKSDVGKDIAKAVEALSRHQHFFTSHVAEVMYKSYIESGNNQLTNLRAPLTERQKDVVKLLAEGKSNKEAASALNISVKTVETHRHQIMRKLHMTSFSELVRYAVREGLVSE